MNRIKTYKLFESKSELDRFTEECHDYLIDLVDNDKSHYQFKIRTFEYRSEFIVEIIFHDKDRGNFYFKDTKSDLVRYTEMSKYKLNKIVCNGCRDDQYSIYQYKRGTKTFNSISEIPEDQYMKGIELYFSK